MYVTLRTPTGRGRCASRRWVWVRKMITSGPNQDMPYQTPIALVGGGFSVMVCTAPRIRKPLHDRSRGGREDL